MKNVYFKFLLSLFLSLISTSCSFPNSKLTNISINGLLTDINGQPLANKLIEVTLPESYGLNEIDLSLEAPSNHGNLVTQLRTDSSGNFNHTFNKIKYNTAFWFLPPLGNFPKESPSPFFVIKFNDKENTIYSLGWDEDKINYAVQRRKKSSTPPYHLTGELFRSKRGEIDSCIANIKLRKTY